ncbi:hypothetical protein, partial [Paracoccus rhizosphaerae]
MMARQEAPFGEAESAAYVNDMEEKKARIIDAQRSRDWSLAVELSSSMTPLLGDETHALTHPVLA